MLWESGRIEAKVRDRKMLKHLTIPDHTHADRSRARMANSPFYLTSKAIR